MNRTPLLLLSGLVLAVATGCASSRPVLYPNTKYRAVGRAAAQQDVNACLAMARQHGASPDRSQDVARDTASSAAVGTAAGAAAGAVAGDAGTGAAAGAAGGAAGGMTRGIFRMAEPDPVFRNFVNRCLRDKGYDVVGWN